MIEILGATETDAAVHSLRVSALGNSAQQEISIFEVMVRHSNVWCRRATKVHPRGNILLIFSIKRSLSYLYTYLILNISPKIEQYTTGGFCYEYPIIHHFRERYEKANIAYVI